jgi:hypothetical protein
MFVPKKMAYSETEFVLEKWLTRDCKLPWSELEYYGDGEGVFMIQFKGRQAFQIFGLAFPRNDWKEFIAYLSNQHPDKKASGNVSGRLFRWGK